MKRYIKAAFTPDIDIDYSIFEGTPFKCDTDTEWYNRFLTKDVLAYQQKEKNRTGEIVMMSPDEYYEACSSRIFSGRSSVDDLKRSRGRAEGPIKEYIEAMRRGDKFPMAHLDYSDAGQEGLHRMMAAGEVFGWDTEFPVLVVTVYDQEREARWRKRQDYNDFHFHTFDKICQEAADNISNWQGLPPDNFTELLHDEIIEVAKTYDEDRVYDIDVEIEIDIVEDYHRVLVYLTRYFDYVPQMLDKPAELWLEHLYNMNADAEPSEAQPTTADLPDFDDIDLDDLFFKD